MRRWLFVVSAVVLCSGCCAAQQKQDFAEIASHAGIIFRGTVLAVVHEDSHSPGDIAVARVSFRVDDGVRGAATGESLTIRQWNVADDEYRVGESLVLFLYPPSDGLGLTSPVSGRAGHQHPEDISADDLNAFRVLTKSATTTTSATSESPSRPQRRRAQ